MVKKYLKILLLVIALTFATTSSVLADTATQTTATQPTNPAGVPWFPLVPCGLSQQPAGIDKSVHDYTQDCNQCLLIELGKNIIDMVLYAIVPIVGTLMFLIAGFIILINAHSGKPDGVATGKKIITDTAIGIAIILSSWLITNFILRTLAPNQAAGVCTSAGVCSTDASKSCKTDAECPGTPWYQIQCRVGSLKDLTDASVPTVGGPRTTGGTGSGGNGSGSGSSSGSGTGSGQCLQSGLNLCQGSAPQGCANNSCGQYIAAVSQALDDYNKSKSAGDFNVTENILKGVMEVESSCNINPSTGAPSYGLMQLTPPIPQIYASRCGVSANNINQGWLTDPSNAKASICIAAQWINAVSKSQCGSDVRNLYAGYNGGENGACAPSVTCAGQNDCAGQPMQKWECLYDSNRQCNGGTSLVAGYNPTRNGSVRLQYCAANPGF